MDEKRSLRILLRLLASPTAPFHEHLVAGEVLAFAKRYHLHGFVDGYGNILLSTTKVKPVVVFCAHMDHPGFEVTRVRKRSCEAVFYGGVALKYFKKARVAFYSSSGKKTGTGVVASVKHNKKDGTKQISIKTNSIKTKGATSVTNICDFGSWNLPAPKIYRGRMYARGIDDVAGCAAMLSMLIELREQKCNVPVACLFTRCEEPGLVGAIAAVKSKLISKNAALISVECSNYEGRAQLEGGPIVRVGDSSSVFDHSVTCFLTNVARGLTEKGKHFLFQRKLMDGGTCEATAFGAFGYRVGGVALPLGNYHNTGKRKIASEFITVDDFLRSVEFLVAVSRRCRNMNKAAKQLATAFQKREHIFEKRLLNTANKYR